MRPAATSSVPLPPTMAGGYFLDFGAAEYPGQSWPSGSWYYYPYTFQLDGTLPADGFSMTLLDGGTITGKVERVGFTGSTSDMWVEVVVYDYGTGAWVRTGDTY